MSASPAGGGSPANWDPPTKESSIFIPGFHLAEACRKVEEAARPLTARILLGVTAFFLEVGDRTPGFVGDLPRLPTGFPKPLREYSGGNLQGVVNAALIFLESEGVQSEDDVTLVLTPNQARGFAASPEFHVIKSCALDALTQGLGYVGDLIGRPDNPNRMWGLPSHLYGLRVEVREPPPPDGLPAEDEPVPFVVEAR